MKPETIEARETEDTLLVEIDEDLPLLHDNYPKGFTTGHLAEFYGIDKKLAMKAIGTMILRGALTIRDHTDVYRYAPAERASGARGATVEEIARLLGAPPSSVLASVEEAAAAERIEHVLDGSVTYVRSLRRQDFRKPSDWKTAHEKRETIMPPADTVRSLHAVATSHPPAASPSKAVVTAPCQVERSTAGLRDALFDALDDLRGPKPDVQRALATAKLAQAIINTAKSEMDFHDRLKRDKDLERNFASGPVALGSKVS